MIAAVVLAAGSGSRFGASAKQLAELDGIPLLEHALRAVAAVPAIERVVVVLGARAEDWAMVGVCALVKVTDGDCEDVRIGLTHMASTPLRASAAEDALRGQPCDAEHIAAAADLAAEGTSPLGDLNATPDYKRHLARVLTRRALTTASGG